MTRPDDTLASAAIEAMLRSARELDPSLDEASVARFWREVEEMDTALATLPAEEAPLRGGFSPTWPGDRSP
jgi:hypothetical protein